jgi:glycosyltransferase involved in cell wall biosynthesis
MIGKPVMPIPDHPQILAPGFVSEAAKLHATRACRFMVTPSPYESLCFAAIEAWLMRKPVLANGNCAVLKAQCIRSNGGLWYADYSEFREGMDRLMADEALVAQLGRQGYDFAINNYAWEEVDRKLFHILSSIASATSGRVAAATAGVS